MPWAMTRWVSSIVLFPSVLAFSRMRSIDSTRSADMPWPDGIGKVRMSVK